MCRDCHPPGLWAVGASHAHCHYPNPLPLLFPLALGHRPALGTRSGSSMFVSVGIGHLPIAKGINLRPFKQNMLLLSLPTFVVKWKTLNSLAGPSTNPSMYAINCEHLRPELGTLPWGMLTRWLVSMHACFGGFGIICENHQKLFRANEELPHTGPCPNPEESEVSTALHALTTKLSSCRFTKMISF